jgi:mono/diheme cytochrome c family protein
MRLLLLTLLGVLLFAACGGSDDTESATAASTSAPSTTSAVTTTSEPATTTSELATTTSAVTTTSEPATTTTTISAEQLAAAEAVGDMTAGEELFHEPLDGITHSFSCSSCHTVDGQPARNPTLIGIGTAAADRIQGMSDIEYLRESILDPYAFKADGEWLSAPMPYTYPDLLTEEQINDVIAYLLTR